jgi:hypothetical protein
LGEYDSSKLRSSTMPDEKDEVRTDTKDEATEEAGRKYLPEVPTSRRDISRSNKPVKDTDLRDKDK